MRAKISQTGVTASSLYLSFTCLLSAFLYIFLSPWLFFTFFSLSWSPSVFVYVLVSPLPSFLSFALQTVSFTQVASHSYPLFILLSLCLMPPCLCLSFMLLHILVFWLSLTILSLLILLSVPISSLCTFHLSLKLSRLSGLNDTDTTLTWQKQALVWWPWHRCWAHTSSHIIFALLRWNNCLKCLLLYVVEYFLKEEVKYFCKKSTTDLAHQLTKWHFIDSRLLQSCYLEEPEICLRFVMLKYLHFSPSVNKCN